MKIKTGTYTLAGQYPLGISYVYFNKMYRAIVLDLIFFYIELVITDYPDCFLKGRQKNIKIKQDA